MASTKCNIYTFLNYLNNLKLISSEKVSNTMLSEKKNRTGLRNNINKN